MQLEHPQISRARHQISQQAPLARPRGKLDEIRRVLAGRLLRPIPAHALLEQESVERHDKLEPLVDDATDDDAFKFLPGVRERLQDALTTTATIDVWRTVAPYLEAATGERPPFSRLLAGGDRGSAMADMESSLGDIAASVIDRLGLAESIPTAIAKADRASAADEWAPPTNACVRVLSDAAMASGFFVAPDLVATTAAVGDGPEYRVLWGGTQINAEVARREGAVLLLRLPAPVEHAEPLAVAAPPPVRDGARWTAVGFPVDRELGSWISGTVRGGQYETIELPVHGYGGGPVLVDGRLVGQVASMLPGPPYAIDVTPLDTLIRALGRRAGPEPLRRLSLKTMPPSDPTAAAILRGGLPFLDRAHLRTSVRSLLSWGRAGILVVNGPPQSGKSYTAEFISHVAAETGEFNVARLTLDATEAHRYESADLALALAARMGRSSDTLPALDEPGPRHNLTLVDWLLSSLWEREKDWWWILDGFSNDGLPLHTRNFLELIIRRVGEGSPAHLVLLDFPDVPANITTPVEHEELLDPSSIGAREVSEFFMALVPALGGAELDSAQVELVTSHVLEGLRQAPDRLRQLANRVVLAADELVSPGAR